MKSIVICVLAIALMSTPSHALLGSLVGAITNGINNVVTSVGNTINTVQNGVNLALLGGQFLWDNAFNPALQTLTSSELSGIISNSRAITDLNKRVFIILDGAEFIDQYFGGILNAVGKRSAEDQAAIIAQKNLVKLNFAVSIRTRIHLLTTLYGTQFIFSLNEIQNQMNTIIAGIKTILFTFLKDAKEIVFSSAQV